MGVNLKASQDIVGPLFIQQGEYIMDIITKPTVYAGTSIRRELDKLKTALTPELDKKAANTISKLLDFVEQAEKIVPHAVTMQDISTNVWTMHREGVFRTKTQEKNQCKSKDTNLFIYMWDSVVKGGLDKNGYVIDHQAIHNQVTSLNLGGSCEEMAGTITLATYGLLSKEDGPKPLVIATCVRPAGRAHAWFKNLIVRRFADEYISQIPTYNGADIELETIKD